MDNHHGWCRTLSEFGVAEHDEGLADFAKLCQKNARYRLGIVNMEAQDVSAKAKALTGMIEKHLGASGKTLEQAVRRAGRRMPGKMRAKAEKLIEAEKLIAHPKLIRRIDMAEVERAYRDIAAYLAEIDLAEERKTRHINLAAGIAFNLLLAVLLMVAGLRWLSKV